MKSVRPHIFITLAAFALGACSSKDSASASDTAGTTTTPAASTAATSSAEPTANDISNYKLDMDKMNKYAAAIQGFAALARTDSAAAESMSSDGNESMTQMISRIEGTPKAMSVLRKAGLDAKDYVWITSAWLQAAMTKGLLDSKSKARVPPGQNLQNVEFLNAHKAELEAMQKAMESASTGNG